jgi:hypothetical protein
VTGQEYAEYPARFQALGFLLGFKSEEERQRDPDPEILRRKGEATGRARPRAGILPAFVEPSGSKIGYTLS